MATVDIEVKGLIETQRNMERMVRDLHGAPMLEAMRTATLVVQRDAKINAPVDSGRLRASITPEVRAMGDEIQGVVGSNVVYAPYVELGTRPHFPPIQALEVWASRHGMTAFLVARAIARKGTKAHKFLTRAFEDNRQRIIDILERGVKKIVEGNK
jgi:HK97 gp10 family phage protein